MDVFGDSIIDIQHFASTAIREMSAKPIIDIMIIVEDININLITDSYTPYLIHYNTRLKTCVMIELN
ncbi:GrpB family protein [Clostridium aciditolerans]|uniref:GrpB family protein n=1 Tax=Clostridium aciditolerans TaxID=339861 RepID=UPI001FE47DE6|nr:GrpB family protein [Clostridium aciditolerans]